ncbi:uncharacterized protein LY89DRAFT_577497 [Mollisia scopiformis]|uniref:Uncharacterized protein n=1 Tax=Mollisia scopiformis TaxID=149040 RepID=A0A194XLP6_MOLSC|nr:uncharacterized protein LY89DRAFT_577497 [Mollisia scopiformis]KUJ21170.1 hypothetical protein LY89DRAFT_577497 [Mollisia scopiformis]
MNHIPWVAVCAITIATLCLIASAAIVVSSDGSVSEWGLQPHVVLGVLSSVATASLVVSLSTGVAITWWHAAHAGTEAHSLHSIWSYSPMGGGAYSMIRHGFKNMNKVAVASTLTALASIAYSPLLQRSSGVTSAGVSTEVPMNLHIVQNLTTNYTGYVDTDFYGNVGVPNDFSGLVQKWFGGNNTQAINQPGFVCDGTCIGSVPSAGMSYTCSNITTSIPLKQQTLNSSFYGFNTTYVRSLDENQNPIMLLTVNYIDGVDENCNANLITKTCNISAGTVDFPIKMANASILTNEKSLPIQNFVPHPYEGDSPDTLNGDSTGPLGGLVWFGINFFWAQDEIVYNNGTGFIDYTNGTMPIQYFDYSYTAPDNPQCSYRWLDPSPDILNAFSEILFWASIDAADVGEAPVTFQVLQTNDRLVYTAVYSYLVVASLMLAAAIVSVAATLYGWWHLDREVSMNPLETARAIREGMFEQKSGSEREMLRLT